MRKKKNSQILTVKKRKKSGVIRERRKELIRSSNRWCLMRVGT